MAWQERRRGDRGYNLRRKSNWGLPSNHILPVPLSDKSQAADDSHVEGHHRRGFSEPSETVKYAQSSRQTSDVWSSTQCPLLLLGHSVHIERKAVSQVRNSTCPEAVQIKEVSLSDHTSALSSARNGGCDEAVKVSEHRVMDGRPLGYSRIIQRGIRRTEIIPNHTWNSISQVSEALAIFRAYSGFMGVETAMNAEFSEGKLEAVVS